MVRAICKILCKEFSYNKNIFKLIKYVQDRPGHDAVYKVNFNKIKKELKWKPKESFNKSITKTIQWYLKKVK